MMPPKVKKGKNVQKVKLGQDENIVTEISKQFFENEIADINRKIIRQGTYQVELKDGMVEFEEKIKEIEREKKEIIEDLKKTLQEREDQREQKKKQFGNLIIEIKTKKENYIQRIEEMGEEYVTMVERMKEKIEELEEWYNTLDHFKEHKKELLAQYEAEQEAIEEREKQHQRDLYEIEQKFEVGKKKIKKELELKLLQLSIDFQEQSEQKMNPSIHRLMRENIAITNELRIMNTTFKSMQQNYLELQGKEEKWRQLFPNQNEERDKLIAQTMVQSKIIENLLDKQKKLIQSIEEIRFVEEENEELRRKLDDMEVLSVKVKQECENLKITLTKKDFEIFHTRETIAALKKASRRLQLVLHNSIKVAEEAIAIQLIPFGKLEDEENLKKEVQIEQYRLRRKTAFEKKGNILKRLLEAISKAQPTKDETKLLGSSVPSFHEEKLNFEKIFKEISKITMAESVEFQSDEEEEKEEEIVKGESLRTTVDWSNESLPRPMSSESLFDQSSSSDDLVEGSKEEEMGTSIRDIRLLQKEYEMEEKKEEEEDGEGDSEEEIEYFEEEAEKNGNK